MSQTRKLVAPSGGRRSPRWTGALATLLLALAVVLSGGSGPAAAAESGVASSASSVAGASSGRTISGTTLDAWGRALAGVQIVLAPLSVADPTGVPGSGAYRALSDEAGRFNVGGLVPGVYRIVAVKGGHSVLVGQINTLVQGSLDLILYPSGRATEPGERPPDGSWALRLPGRDRLEDRAAPSDADEAFEEAAGGEPLALTLRMARLGDGGHDRGWGSGVGLGIGAALDLDERGLLEVDLGHQHQGQVRTIRSQSDRLISRWYRQSGREGLGQLEFGIGRSWTKTPGPASTDPGLALEREWLQLGAQHTWSGRRTSLLLRADARLAGGQQDAGASPGDDVGSYHGERVALELAAHRRWTDRRRSAARIALRHLGGGLWHAADGSERALLALADDGTAALSGLDGTTLDLRLEDVSVLSPALSFTTSGSVEATTGPGGELLGSGGAAVSWRAARSTRVEIAGGVGFGGADPTEPLWRLEVEQSLGEVRIAASRSRETGVLPWQASMPSVVDLPNGIVTDRRGVSERWALEARWEPGSAWTSVALRGELYEMAGRLAARLVDDLALVPVTGPGSEAEGGRVELGIAITPFGTSLMVAWEEMSDNAGDERLVAGADGWMRRSVELRQRLCPREWLGTDCHLLLGYEQQDLTGLAEDAESTGRQMLLERRRYSGGLALAF
jgi:hypothetical protein